MKRILEAIRLRQRRRRLLVGCLAALCCTVALGVGFGLMHPAVTMGQEPECGYVAHTHSEQCFESLTVNHPLICGFEEHIHADLCYNAQGELTCELPEHTHAETCYGEPETVVSLVCSLPEHIHTESCYPETPAYVLGPQTYCGLAEHTHGEDCGENCTIPEHTHTESCYIAPASPEPEMPEEPEEEADPESPATVPEALYARFAPDEADRERLDALLESFSLSPEELLELLDAEEIPIPDLDALVEYLTALFDTETLDDGNSEATMPMQFFLTLMNAVPTAEDTTVHNTIKFSQHFSMTGYIKPITGYTSMEDWPMVPPSEAAWKAVVRANYPTLTEEQISHLEVVWVGAAPKSEVESSNNAYRECSGHVDGYLRWADGYEGPNLAEACGITLTAGMWWNGQVAGNATCVLLRKNAEGEYVEYDRKTFARDPHTGEYDHIWTGLPGAESDYAMRIDGLDTNLWTIKYADGTGYGESNFSEDLPYTKPFMFEGGNWGRYGYKMLAWAFWKGNAFGSLRLEKQTLLNGTSAPDATPEEALFTITNTDGTYQNTVKYRDFLKDDQGNRYLVLDHLQTGQYTVTESGAEKPGYILRVTESATAEVRANETATASLTNTYTTGAELPDTGGTGTFPLYLLGCTLTALAAAPLLGRKRGI